MMSDKMFRRDFLRVAGSSLVAAPLAIGAMVAESSGKGTGSQKAILFDARRCIGCKGCQVACKAWNDLPAEKTEVTEKEYTNPPDFSPNTWKVVRFKEIGSYDPEEAGSGGLIWRMLSDQCRHCLNPSCVCVCPSGALWKRKDGPVLYDPRLCIGCKYCMMACPWHVPRFDKETHRIRKCVMCFDRIDAGMEPACVATCTTDALQFGDRDEILAKSQKATASGGYIYGDKEAGGTSFIVISDVPPASLGLPTVGPEPPAFNLRMLRDLSLAGAVGAIVLGGIAIYARGRGLTETP